MDFIANHNTVPISIVRFVIENDMIRAFSIFLYLKNMCNCIIPDCNLSICELGSSIGIKDTRTIHDKIFENFTFILKYTIKGKENLLTIESKDFKLKNTTIKVLVA